MAVKEIGMSEDIRYKMQHLGDIFVDALSSVVDSAQRLAKGVVLSYDIRDLKNKRRQCLGDIGQRIVQVKKTGLVDLQRDDILLELFSKAQKLAQLIGSYEKKKQEAA
jgi:hypothetical protein